MRLTILPKKENEDVKILREIRFGYLEPYKVAGMGEPWSTKIDRTLALLREHGIGAILTLTEDDHHGTRYENAGFRHHHEPINDCEPPDSVKSMDRAVAFIENCLAEKLHVAVHCLEGRGRTGMVLAAWLGRKENLDSNTAIGRVYEGRFHTVITPSQRDFLREYLDGEK